MGAPRHLNLVALAAVERRLLRRVVDAAVEDEEQRDEAVEGEARAARHQQRVEAVARGGGDERLGVGGGDAEGAEERGAPLEVVLEEELGEEHERLVKGGGVVGW